MSKAAFLLRYGNAKHITDVLHDIHGDYTADDLAEGICNNHHWGVEHSKKIIDDGWYRMPATALAHPTTTPEMLHDAIDSGDYSLMHAAAIHPNATEEHHLKMLKAPNDYPIMDMFGLHPNISHKVFEEGAKSPSRLVRMTISDHPHAPDHVIHQLTTDPDEKVSKRAKAEWDMRTMADGFK